MEFEANNKFPYTLGDLFASPGLGNSSWNQRPAWGGSGIIAQAGMGLSQSATLGGLFGLTAAASPPKWLHVTGRFKTFLGNLELTAKQIQDGLAKCAGVVSCLNEVYWGIKSETANAIPIGSWAKNTSIRPPRDVDLYFVLPPVVYHRFQAYSQHVNRQSALLQEVKDKLCAMPSYRNSNIKGDGPVVLADFTTYSIEIVPAFLLSYDDRSFYVCDTTSGGRYMTTKPLHEIDAIDAADARTNGNARRLIRMLKCWQAYCSVPIKSFFLELLAIDFLDQWPHKRESFFYYDWMCRDFFEWMITKANTFIVAPGTWDAKWLGDAWKSRAESALGRARKACDFERDSDMWNAGDEWQKIFGGDIPKFVV